MPIETIVCPKCGSEIDVEVEIFGNQCDDMYATLTPLGDTERQQTFLEFVRDAKLPALESSTFYGGKPLTYAGTVRVQTTRNLLEEYNEKKARGKLKLSNGGEIVAGLPVEAGLCQQDRLRAINSQLAEGRR